MARRPRRRLLIVGAAVLVVVLGIGVALAIPSDDGVPASVSIAGADVSGLDAAGVRRVAQERAEELMGQPLEITRTDDPDYRIRVTRESLDARPQIKNAVEDALEARSFGGRLLGLVGAVPEREVPLRFTLNPRKVSRLVNRVTGDMNDPAVPASLEVTETDIVLTPGEGGHGVAAADLRAQILDLPETIALTPGPLEPPVSDAEAEKARQTALKVIAAPVEITLGENGVPIETEVLRSALRFTPRSPALQVSLDPDVLYEDIKSAFETREQPAREAGFRVNGNNVSIITSRTGRSLDMEAIAASIVAAPGTPAVRARFRVSEPERTTAEIKDLGITELVADFSTPYNCCEPRVTNIQRAAEILDGYIIPAGGRFSLNDVLGPRTEEAGFVEAPQIAGGRLEDAVGGGVSQVATTMFNAAFFAGLDLVAHTPHSFWISRYPQGREATVSMGGPELIFDNDWEAAILISASASDNAISIKFFSTAFGRRVETETGPQTDIVEPEIKETVNPELEPGERVVEQEMGGAGFTVTYTRKVYKDDDLIKDENYTWTYDPQDAYVEIGPEAPRRPNRGGTTTGGDEPEAPEEEPDNGGGTTTQAPAPDPAPEPEPDPPAGGGAAPPPPG
ncbi:MAG: VanW family protein [Thermoleophilia bacterium]